MQLPLFCLELSTPLGVQLAPLCSWAEADAVRWEKKSLRVFLAALFLWVFRREGGLGPNAAREACRHDVGADVSMDRL